MSQSRRSFLKTAGIIGAGVTGIKTEKLQAAPENIISDDRMGVLVDTTVCIGCRRCEYACKEAHDIPPGNESDYNNRDVYKEMRRPRNDAFTVVNEYENPQADLPTNIKIQCMHCDHPACVSACIVGAFSKKENGSVVWDSDRCIGCRYCMIACPFQIPTFEYEKAIHPRILKCDFCFDRTQQGQLPACVNICPVEALTYGKRYDLVKLAHKKIADNPDRYIDHVYGEHEAGGTSWMYLANKDFTQLGLPEKGAEPAPGASESLQHAIFKYFLPPASLFALLGGIMWLGRNKNKSEAGE